jgi:Uma2 family endonuclease
MTQTANRIIRTPAMPEPTWDIAYLFPAQGTWDEEEYLALETNRLVEFSNGYLEVLPMPTTTHQLLVAYLHGLLFAFATQHDLGTALLSALRVRLWRGKFREPDVVFMRKEHSDRIGEEYWKGADLVMEVVSDDPKDRRRDLQTKRREYARAAISEYWIVDPQLEEITVLRLIGKRYVVHGKHSLGAQASSHLLPGFIVDVSAVFARRITPASASKTKQKAKRPRPKT